MATRCYINGCTNRIVATSLELLQNNTFVEINSCQDHFEPMKVTFALPNPLLISAATDPHSFELTHLAKVLCLIDHDRYSLVLKSQNSDSVFVLETGYVEICSIYGSIIADSDPTPLTFQLMLQLIDVLGGTFMESTIDRYNQDLRLYESYLTIRMPGQSDVLQVRCRGSDAIGLSVLAKKPIKINTAFLGRV